MRYCDLFATQVQACRAVGMAKALLDSARAARAADHKAAEKRLTAAIREGKAAFDTLSGLAMVAAEPEDALDMARALFAYAEGVAQQARDAAEAAQEKADTATNAANALRAKVELLASAQKA